MRSELVSVRRARDDWEGSDLAHALAVHVDGEVRFDRGARALYATDSSNYRQPPIGVVVPRTVEALIAAVALCREHGAPIVARGGGTSLAGQTTNHAVVIDCSRWLHACEIDPGGTARVEPGAIMKSVRVAANRFGWELGPDPSTHDRCTIGGMLGNNSCGVHSVFSEFYGPGPRISDHVIELDVLTYDGVRLRARRTDEAERARVRSLGGRAAEIYDRLEALRDRVAPLVRERYPKMPRRVSGYNLDELLPEAGFHVGRALVGSEATCVMILGAELQLMPAKPARVLVVIGFADIYAAAAAANEIRTRRPIALEAFDDTLAARVKNQHKDSHEALKLLPRGGSWLLIEHGGQTIGEARAEAERTAALFGGTGHDIYDDHASQESLRDLREQALGVDAFAVGKPDTYEGWEDSAVPPAHLESYLRDLHALYDQYGLHGSLYGHFGQGCVHTRIDFQLHTDAGVERYRRFTLDAAKLVVAHGGALSGEHGDGQSKAELYEIMFGKELVLAFEEFKSIWDPDHGMNPGKMVWPNPRTSDLRLRHYDPDPDAFAGAGAIALTHGPDGRDFGHAAVRCVGIGKCRKLDAGTMCPSYMVTLDERHSTRGRAHMLFEMMRADVITDGWRSDLVRESLDLCLACKACKKECPTGVDMASYKAEFMTHHWKGRLRPRSQYAFGWLHRWLALARPIAPVANLLARTPGLRALIKWIAGISQHREIPRLASRSFRRSFVAPPAERGAPRVILWPDTFTDAFYPEILHAAAAVLAGAGYAVEIPRRRLCCARPMIEYGMLSPARRLWRRTLDDLGESIDRGIPVVGVEPSCVATFRDELTSLLPDLPRAHKLSAQTFTLAELLARDRIAIPRARDAGAKAIYHRHCHQAAVLSPELEERALTEAGLEVEHLDAGCCGMAGAFGFLDGNYELSVALAERVLLPRVRAELDAIVIADGFSCREQLRQLGGVRAKHTAEILADADWEHRE